MLYCTAQVCRYYRVWKIIFVHTLLSERLQEYKLRILCCNIEEP